MPHNKDLWPVGYTKVPLFNATGRVLLNSVGNQIKHTNEIFKVQILQNISELWNTWVLLSSTQLFKETGIFQALQAG